MTALELLGDIGAALLLQMLAGLALVLWRRRGLAAAATPAPAGAALPQAPAGAWPGWRDFRVARRGFEDVAESQCSFELQPVDGGPLPAFEPGQYLTFSLPTGDPSDTGRRLIRCYSLSAPPDPAGYRITVKRAAAPAGRPELPPGEASTYLHDRVREGDVLKVKAPAGHFFIDREATVPVVFIAGGIGITPMMSMLRWCLAAQPERPMHLFYGVRNSADQAFKATLEALAAAHPALALHVLYLSPGPEDVLGRDFEQVGMIQLDLIRSRLSHGRHQFYVCGPPPMMQSLVPALRAWGVLESDLHFESFGPASVKPLAPLTNEPLPAAGVALEVRLARSARTLVWDGQDANLLDFAERHGVAVSSGCRSGSCGACETRLVAGRVGYAEAPDHDITQGACLLCVGQPQSALELDL